MTWMIDAVIALTVLEAAWLLWRSRRPRALAPADFVPNLLAGLCLMLALRALASAASWPWLAACLAAAGLSHLLDMRRRWRSARPRNT